MIIVNNKYILSEEEIIKLISDARNDVRDKLYNELDININMFNFHNELTIQTEDYIKQILNS